MRYLAIPKTDPVTAHIISTNMHLHQKDKVQQYATLKDARKKSIASSDTSAFAKNLMRDPAEFEVNLIASPDSQTFVTGTMVFTSDAGIEELKHELDEYNVIEDLPIELIRPSKVSTSTNSEIAEQDLWHLGAIRLLEARSFGFKGRGDGITTAVLDTGIEEVKALDGKIASNYMLNNQTGQAFTNPITDTDGHGTHVAGLIAGENVGVAPASRLISITMIPHGRGHISDFIFAIEHAATIPEVTIINISAGIPGFNPAISTAIFSALSIGMLPIVAIGNEGPSRSRSPGNYPDVLAVGASNRADRVASFSGSGNFPGQNGAPYSKPDLCAPGQQVTSCTKSGGFEAWNGTSMAAPIVSGIAALAMEAYPEITVGDLRDLLLENCHELLSLIERQGAGRLEVPPSIWKPVI